MQHKPIPVNSQQELTDRYAIYCGDCITVMRGLRDCSVDLSAYSPPFGGIFQYSSLESDLSNCRSYQEFFEHYEFVVEEILRLTKPGRHTAVHAMDVPGGHDNLIDFPGDIIRLHQKLGFHYHARYAIWKEPLRVAIRTRSKGLMHKQLVKDSSLSGNAGADYVLIFRAPGDNKVPITHSDGLLTYIGEREIPEAFEDQHGNIVPTSAYRNGWADAKTNKLSHWIWQQYASSFWDDIRNNRILPYKAARDSEEEKHCHPLQLDVVERITLLWSNRGEIVLTPFMGVGSEVCGPLVHARRGIGIELKESFYRQAKLNIARTIEAEKNGTDTYTLPFELDSPEETDED